MIYSGLLKPTKTSIVRNYQLLFRNEEHTEQTSFGFDTEHDARNAEKFALYCIKQGITQEQLA
jgi:hypothetical protein